MMESKVNIESTLKAGSILVSRESLKIPELSLPSAEYKHSWLSMYTVSYIA